jgi:hypothetical protein
MFYDVSVTRTSTATRTIRVEADDMESARRAALELAGDQDCSGCVVEYDFDANEVVEVKDENAQPDCSDETMPEGYDVADETAGEVNLASEEARCPDLGDGTCALCPTVFPGVSDAVIDAGWLPSYFINDDECSGPVCPTCAEQFIVYEPEYGEATLSLKGEYVSVWNGGVEVRSICTVDPRTRKIEIEHTANVDGLEKLDREYVVLNSKEYPAANQEERFQYSADEQAGMFFHE